MALTYDQVEAITKKFYLPKFPQLAFNRNFLQMRLYKKGIKHDGGDSIMQPIKYQASKGGFYTEFQEFDIAAEQQITSAEFDWTYGEVPITLSRQEILRNSGPERVKSLLDAKMDLATEKASDIMATAIFATGAQSTTAFTSLDHICNDASDTLGTGTTLGGISKATSGGYAWWVGKLKSAGGAGIGPTPLYLANAWFDVVDGDTQPTIIIGHNNSLAVLWKTQIASQRYMKQDLMDLGFTAMEFNGKPYVADLHVSDATTTVLSNRVYMLNENYLDFVVHSKENMRLEPFATPINQAAKVAHIMFAAQLTVSYPKRHICLYNFDSTDTTDV